MISRASTQLFGCSRCIRRFISFRLSNARTSMRNGMFSTPLNLNFTNHPQRCVTTTSHSQESWSRKTVYALSSGQGRAGIAVIRLSGSKCQTVLKQLICRPKIPEPRVATHCGIFSPVSGELLDRSIVLWFPGPKSFTGEDVCEFHVHGGPAVIEGVLSALGSCEDLHPAEPGEFTKRAFLNGKLDLTEVEGLADLIAAETEVQRRQALRQMSGELAGVYQQWRRRLLKIVAHVEAFIDFSEDENIEGDILDQASESLSELKESVRHHLADNRRGERLRSGVHVAIVGEPNAGKSSLLNLICKRPAAIVAPIAGTTRDVIESAINLGGYPVVLGDTAGIRHSDDLVEQEGVRRATERARFSDIVLLVFDVSSYIPSPNTRGVSQGCDWRDIISSRISLLAETIDYRTDSEHGHDDTSTRHQIVLLNKVDLLSATERESMHEAVGSLEQERGSSWCCLSCETTEGIDNFLEVLRDKVADMCGDPLVGNPSLTQQRHRTHLTRCLDSMSKVIFDDDLVIGAEHLREALRQLGKVTGHVGVEEILDVMFKDFCIGK